MTMRFASMLVALGVLRASSAPQTMRFAGIQWGDTPAAVDAKLRSHGFAPLARDGDDIGFRGRVAGYDGDGWVYFAGGHAVKTQFIIASTAARVLSTYDDVRRWVARQYGATRHQTEIYQPPYARGDGRTIEALQAGKVFIGSAWKDGPDTGPLEGSDPGIIVRATKELRVTVSFEGPGWTAEARRRIAAGQR
jgi:hypothetical protein